MAYGSLNRRVSKGTICHWSLANSHMSFADVQSVAKKLDGLFDFAEQALFDDSDAFDLAFRRKAFVEAFVTELIVEIGP
jgi:hypothetical protein